MPISDSRGIVPRRLLRGLGAFAIAATAGGAATPAFAQLDDYGGGYAYYGRGYERDYGYGPSRRFDYAPLPPAPIPPRAVERIAMREFGLVEVQRTVRTRSAIVVDGQVANGSRVRLILDRYSGDLIDRIVLQPAPARTVRLDPQDQQPAAKKLAPRPPEKPAALKPAKPAGQASAPATAAPPSPAAPQPNAAPAKSAPLPAAAPKEIGKGLVNPQDVRGSDEPERAPPLARAQPGIPTPDTSLPPVQIEETRRAEPAPAPAIEIVPVTPH